MILQLVWAPPPPSGRLAYKYRMVLPDANALKPGQAPPKQPPPKQAQRLGKVKRGRGEDAGVEAYAAYTATLHPLFPPYLPPFCSGRVFAPPGAQPEGLRRRRPRPTHPGV